LKVPLPNLETCCDRFTTVPYMFEKNPGLPVAPKNTDPVGLCLVRLVVVIVVYALMLLLGRKEKPLFLVL
jgi:hypothetical protein